VNLNDYVYEYLKTCPMPACNAPISHYLPRGVTSDGHKAKILLVCQGENGKDGCYSHMEIDRESFEKRHKEVLDVKWYPGWCNYGSALV